MLKSIRTIRVSALSGLLLLGVLAAPLTVSAHPKGMDMGKPRQVSVTGTATIEVDPDYARVRLGVAESRPTANEARDAVAKVVAAFQELCDDLGVARKDISTTGVRINPEYARQGRASNDEGPRIVGYRVSRELVVMLRDLEQLGPLIERSIALGANQASPPNFGVDDLPRLQRDALALAAKDARARADVLASTLDARLGAVREIGADNNAGPPPIERFQRARAMASPADGEETYDPGQIRISTSVRVSFDLLPGESD